MTRLSVILMLLSAVASTRCGGDRAPAPTRPPSAEQSFAVEIGRGNAPGLSATNLSSHTARIACAICHGETSLPSMATRSRAGDTVHGKVTVEHGKLECASCHHAERPHVLRTASGGDVAIEESIELCSQCHGPTRKAFDHGAHGGMRGYWDLSQGKRERNTCTACHDPHAPSYPLVQPMPGPKDRFRGPEASSQSLIGERFKSE